MRKELVSRSVGLWILYFAVAWFNEEYIYSSLYDIIYSGLGVLGLIALILLIAGLILPEKKQPDPQQHGYPQIR